MPKNKSEVQGAKAVATGGAADDDDFDKMLAEVSAEDSQLPADVRASTARTVSSISSSSSSSSSSSGSGEQGPSLPGLHVSQNAIIGACKRGDIAQLRRWGRQGIRVKNADLLVNAILDEISLGILRCLVKELGADVNGARLTDGGTPLYAAAWIGNLPYVQFLVKELGADVNQAAVDGATPLFIAAQNGSLALVQCLIKELGADVNQTKYDGGTPLYLAAQDGRLAVVRCLVMECGANINQAHVSQETPLYIAAQAGHLAVLRCLVKEAGADVNKATHDGVTPLMIAARFEHADVVTFLIKYGANVQDSADAHGTAADISKEYAAPSKQTKYLEARTHCAKPGCDGAGAKKCARCLKVYYCTRECQLANWSAHKAECRRSADKTTAKRPEECQP
jgi:ankyrin repeat protein